MLLISIVDLSSITMYGFRAECNGGGFYSVFYIIRIISVMASRNLLWKFNSSGTKSSNFPRCILVGNNYFVCDSLKKNSCEYFKAWINSDSKRTVSVGCLRCKRD